MIDKGSFKNVSRSYTVSFAKEGKEDFTELANALAEWLNSASGYARLEDSYEPDYFRLACYQKTVEITNAYQMAGSAAIEFNCKPQRFLKSGERLTQIGNKKKILKNPTEHSSLPIIKIYGESEGEIHIGENIITVLSIDGYLTIDSELMEVYKDDTNCNSNIKFSMNSFPKLKPGMNEIYFSGGITHLEVIPKWWTI